MYMIGVSGYYFCNNTSVGMSLLCFFSLLLSNSQEMCQLCRRKCPLCPCATEKSLPLETVSGSARSGDFLHASRVFDSSVDCPTAPALPAMRVSRDLTLSREIKRPRQVCSIMKQLERRVLGWAPGNPLTRFWSYYYYEARYHENTPCCCLDLQSTTPFAEHYTCIIPVKLPDYSGNYAGILDASLHICDCLFSGKCCLQHRLLPARNEPLQPSLELIPGFPASSLIKNWSQEGLDSTL